MNEVLRDTTECWLLQDNRSYVTGAGNMYVNDLSHHSLRGLFKNGIDQLNFSRSTVNGLFFNENVIDQLNFSRSTVNGLFFNENVIDQLNFSRSTVNGLFFNENVIDQLNFSRFTVGGPYFNENVIDQLDIVFNCFCLHFLCLLGVLTNTLNILVLWKHSFNETTTIWLFSMSISDLIASMLQPLRRLNCIIYQFDQVAALTFRSISVVYLVFIPDIFTAVSVFHTTFIALERLVAVWFPLKVSSIFTTYRVKWTIGLMYVYTVVMLSPTWFFLDFAYIYDPKYNATRGAYFLSRFYASNYDTLYKYSSGSLTHIFTTATFLTIVTFSVIISIKMTFGRRKMLSKLSSVKSTSKLIRDLKIVKMVLTVCAVNSGISLPTVTIHLFLFYFKVSILTAGKLHYLLRSIIYVLYQVNADINSIIYVKMSSKFALTLSRLLKRCKRNRSNLCAARCDAATDKSRVLAVLAVVSVVDICQVLARPTKRLQYV